jgi:hypothetical protein
LTHFSPNKILESFEILRLTRFERRKFDSRKMIPKKAQDDNFVRQDFCGKKKKKVCFNEEIQREDFLGNTRRLDQGTQDQKNTKTKNPKITIFQPNSFLKYHSIKHFLKIRPSTKTLK